MDEIGPEKAEPGAAGWRILRLRSSLRADLRSECLAWSPGRSLRRNRWMKSVLKVQNLVLQVGAFFDCGLHCMQTSAQVSCKRESEDLLQRCAEACIHILAI